MTPQLSIETARVFGTRKAAIRLMGIGEPISANVIRQLDADEIRCISDKIASIRQMENEGAIASSSGGGDEYVV